MLIEAKYLQLIATKERKWQEIGKNSEHSHILQLLFNSLLLLMDVLKEANDRKHVMLFRSKIYNTVLEMKD